MKRIKIDPTKYPKEKSESWWIVHPNSPNCEFRLPSGAVTVCIEPFLKTVDSMECFDYVFEINKVYNVISTDNHNGWITVEGNGDLYEMPHYLFARHFDAEAFVVGAEPTTKELKGAVPFSYKPTLPKKDHLPEQLELFRG